MDYDNLFTYEFINRPFKWLFGHFGWLDSRIANYYGRKVTRKLNHYTDHESAKDIILSKLK